jgi:hypothetical protein
MDFLLQLISRRSLWVTFAAFPGRYFTRSMTLVVGVIAAIDLAFRRARGPAPMEKFAGVVDWLRGQCHTGTMLLCRRLTKSRN